MTPILKAGSLEKEEKRPGKGKDSFVMELDQVQTPSSTSPSLTVPTCKELTILKG